MRKLLILAGIFTVLAYNAQARYYEEDGYYYEEQPRYERQVRYRDEPRYTRQSSRFRRITAGEEREYKERRYYKEASPTNIVRPYIGMDIAYSSIQFETLETEYGKVDLDKLFEKNNMFFSVVLGTKINENFGVEAFYQKSGEGKQKIEYENFKANNKLSYVAYGADAIGYVPTSQNFEVLASLGFAQYDFEAELSSDDIIKKDVDSLGVRLGVGGQYYLTDNLAIRAMARYVYMTDDEYVKSLTELSLGLRYMF